MLIQKIDLYKYFKIDRNGAESGFLTTYVLDAYDFCPGRVRPAMLVIAGGGYAHLSQREKEPIAIKYLEQGFNAFTLDYSLMPTKYPAQLLEGAMAMAYIKKNAEKFNVDKNHVAAVGFSAGGHLCAMLATLFDSPVVLENLKNNAKFVRPDAVVLSYPVITSGEKAHRGSFDCLCGLDKDLREQLSLENRVTPCSSPAFIWATMEDNAVPVENSMLMAKSYKENGVPFELHIFETGAHGLSVCTQETVAINKPAEKWLQLSYTWLKNRGFDINK